MSAIRGERVANAAKGSRQRLAAQGDIPECRDERLLQLAVHAAKDVVGFAPRHRWSITPVLDQGCEDVGDRQYPDEVSYAFRAKSVGIAASVEIFVMVPNAIQDFGRDCTDVL